MGTRPAADPRHRPLRLENRLLHLQSYAVVRVRPDLLDGVDPRSGLRGLIARATELGIDGINCLSLEGELALLTQDPQQRMVLGARMIEETRSYDSAAECRPRALLELAEAHAQAGRGACRALALEASRDLRRCHVIVLVHLPDGLLRCARLLEKSDPKEAATLMHVARRWLKQALPHTPAFARRSFMTELPVSRLLLGAVPAPGWPADIDAGRTN